MATNNSNYISESGIRIEFAILQESIPAGTFSIGKFKIPTLITATESGTISTSSKSIRNSNMTGTYSSSLHSSDIIKIPVPMEYTFFWGADGIVPAGTRFLVAYVGANVNEIAIIGRFDRGTDAPTCKCGRCFNKCKCCNFFG